MFFFIEFLGFIIYNVEFMSINNFRTLKTRFFIRWGGGVFPLLNIKGYVH